MATDPITETLLAANAEILRLRAELATRTVAVIDATPAPPPLDALIERQLALLTAEVELARAGHGEGNPNHKGKGKGGGQFTSGGGHGGGESDKGNTKGGKASPGKGVAPSKSGADADAPRREKAKPIYGAMATARREGKGKEARIVMDDGSEPPAHIKPGMVPPMWTDVQVSVDPKAEVLVRARDAKGRPKMVLAASFTARAAAVKFGRVSELVEKHDAVTAEIQAARKKDATREEAECAWLMQVQATRPGSDADTKAKQKAYGATTLEARHVVQSEDGVRLQFVGKEGVEHDHLVRDPKLAAMLVGRAKAAVSPDGKLFRTSDTKVRDFVAGLDGGKFSPKDFRTSAATRMARDAVAVDPERSRTPKEHAVRVKAVAVKVSRLLGNRPAQALESYIHPDVFRQWGTT